LTNAINTWTTAR